MSDAQYTTAMVHRDEIAEVRVLAVVALVVVPLAALALIVISAFAAPSADDERAGPMVGPGFVDSFAVTCLRTAATKIQAPCGQQSYSAHVPADATASVVFGDADITASAGGEVVPADGKIGGNVAYEYCRTTLDAGVTIEVRALCASEP